MIAEMLRPFNQHVPRNILREDIFNVTAIKEAKMNGEDNINFEGYRPIIMEAKGEGSQHQPISNEDEPLMDIIELNDEVKVIAHLPGIKREDIDIHVTSNILTIKVSSEKMRYYRKIDLPAEISRRSVRATYKNGVLEVALKKKNKSDKIKIEI